MQGIIFFTYAQPHLSRLAVSLFSLRKVYHGPVTVLNAGGDEGIVDKLVSDKRLNVNCIPIEIPQRRKHTAYCAKPSLWRWTPYDRSLYLDADTIVVSDPSEALQAIGPLVVTRFSNWITTGNIYSSRIRQWLSVSHPKHDVSSLARACLEHPYPAINTGVFVFDRDNPELEKWESLTQAGHTCSFTDELALQILIPKLSVGWLTDRFNASPIYRHCTAEEVVIWHFHGCKNLRKEVGKDLWWPVFQEVLAANVGGIQEWYRADKSLRGVQVTV